MQRVDIKEFIDTLIAKLPKLNPVDTQVVLKEQYETAYGIYNHRSGSKARPLASVAMFPSENYTEYSSHYDALLDYASHGYKDIWGLNIDEYLNRPRYEIRMMREIAEKIMKRREEVSGSIDEMFGRNHKSK